jgi:hypothetical protein
VQNSKTSGELECTPRWRTSQFQNAENTGDRKNISEISMPCHHIICHIITKELADYSATKSYLEKNNHYFAFSPISEKPVKDSNPPPSPKHASGRYLEHP